MCMPGLKSKDKIAEAPAKKPNRFMTNSMEVHKQLLNRKCGGSCPRNVHLMEARAKAAAI